MFPVLMKSKASRTVTEEIPGVVWTGVSPAGRVLRVLETQAHLGARLHYVLMCDAIPVDSRDSKDALIERAQKEWAS